MNNGEDVNMEPNFDNLQKKLIPSNHQLRKFLDSCTGVMGQSNCFYWKDGGVNIGPEEPRKKRGSDRFRIGEVCMTTKRWVYIWFCREDDIPDRIVTICGNIECINPLHLDGIFYDKPKSVKKDNTKQLPTPIKKRSKRLDKNQIFKILEYFQKSVNGKVTDTDTDTLVLLENKTLIKKIILGKVYGKHVEAFFSKVSR